ncbi:thioredoxin 1 [Flammeovirgaceae bacterium 311]|nr:thioredoxin 1 [Flammeovirgaceae bacterium 311]
MKGQHYIRFAYAILLVGLFACSKPVENSLSPNIFVYTLHQNPGQLIDVRSNSDWAEEHLPGSLNLSFDDPEAFKRAINRLNRRSIYYLYCHDGDSSTEAMRYMQKAGFLNVYSLKGGLHNLKQEGYSVAGF